MKKTPLLNAALSELIASLGHGDLVVIGDAGLPVPPGTRCIDLALTRNVPRFGETLAVVLQEMQVQAAVVARETAAHSPAIGQEVADLLGDTPVQVVSHDALKEMTGGARAVVRTGEFTPYANIILIAGVVF